MRVDLQQFGSNPLFQAFFRDAKLTSEYYRLQSKILDSDIVPNTEANNLALGCVAYLHFREDGLNEEEEEFIGDVLEEFNEVPVFTYNSLKDIK